MFRRLLDFLTVLFVPLYFIIVCAALATGGLLFFTPAAGEAVAGFLARPIVYFLAVLLMLAWTFRRELSHVFRRQALALTLPILLLALCGPAFADTTGADTSSGLLTVFQSALTALAIGVLTFIAHVIDKRTGMNTEAAVRSIEIGHRDAIDKATATAAGLVMKALQAGADKSSAFATGVSWVETGVSEAISYFGLSGDSIETKIQAKIFELFGLDALAVTPAATPATTS